jgi:glycosyltransferase involved in cell wall biosynthesis
MSEPRLDVLVVQDYLQVNGGAERLVLTAARAFPTSRLLVSGVYPGFARTADVRGVDIQVAGRLLRWLPRVVRALLVFGWPARIPIAAGAVLYSGIYAPLAVRRQGRGLRIYYCHTPPRFAFDRRQEYLERVPLLFRPVLGWAFDRYRSAYCKAVRSMDLVLTNSRHVQARLERDLGIQARVLYPPIDTRGLTWLGQGNYYLSVARLEANKRVEHIVRAFLLLPDQQLVVASGGSQLARLQRLAAGAANIRFTDWVDDTTLNDLIGHAVAVLYLPRDEDFGMSAVEAMAAGKPVIGVAEGGLKETVVDGETGILLDGDPVPEAIAQAVTELTPERAAAMRMACERRAQLFARERFVAQLNAYCAAKPEV